MRPESDQVGKGIDAQIDDQDHDEDEDGITEQIAWNAHEGREPG